mgnify:CR=1 FL=1
MAKAGDGLDLHLGVGLSVTHLALGVLLGTIGEDGDLLPLAVLDDLRGHLGTLNNGSPELEVAIVAGSDHSVKFNSGICFSVQLLDEKNIAFADAILLPTGLDDSVHDTRHLPLLKTRCAGRRPNGRTWAWNTR